MKKQYAAPIFILLSLYIGFNGAFLFDYILEMNVYYFWIPFVVFTLSFFLGRFIDHLAIGRFIKVFGALFLSLFLPFLYVAIPVDLLLISLYSLELLTSHLINIILIIGLFTFITLLLVMYRNAWSPVVQHHTINSTKGSEASSFKIAVITDIHLGNINGNRRIQQLVKKVNRLEADAIALVGDVMEDNIEPLKRNKMFDELSKLQSKLGTFVVLGNHEFYGQDVDEYVEHMQRANFSLLRDEIINLGDSISIIGRKDAEDPSDRKLAKHIVNDVSKDRFGIVLDHQPLDLDELSDYDHIDLIFSGHTHRGQVSPLQFVTNKKFPLDYGIKTTKGTSMIVSSGFGTWGPPIRLGSRSEIRFVDVRFRNATS
ncbi:hypothetical protein DH09_03700 [Bacillaceae bacterium JMAK1]|nr:hypothetical protein DH09_03700 [Bacillaceae bacterium JMAK1]